MNSKQSQHILHSKTSYQTKNQNIYNQKKYHILNEIIPKNSILNKVKYKPNFSIGQYFKNKEKDSEVINLNNKPNYISKVKNIGKKPDDILDNELNEYEFVYNDVNLDDLSPIKTKGDNNIISQKVLTERNNNRYKSKIFNNYNPNNDYQNYYLKTERKVDKINNDYEYNVLNTYNNYNNYGYMNLDENTPNNKNYRKKDLYLNVESNNNYAYNPKLKTKMKDFSNIYSKEYSEDVNNDSFRVRYINTNKTNKKKRYFYSIDFTNKDNNLNTKLEEYRIKLFREFYKHFKQFYLKKIKNYFKYFIKKVNNDNETNNLKYFFSKRLKNSITNINSTKAINLPKLDFKDAFKHPSIKDNFYKRINKNYIYQIINNTNNINNSTFNISKNNINNTTNNKTPNTYSRNNYLKSAPKTNEIRTNKLIDNSLSFSSSFQIGNTTIVNRNISFKNESNENELFRDSKELKRKYNQIRTRKERSTNKNDNRFTMSANSEIIEDNDSHLKLDEIRKYMKLKKKSREKKSNEKDKNKIKDKDNTYEINDYKYNSISYQTQNKSRNKKESSTENVIDKKSNSKNVLSDKNKNKDIIDCIDNEKNSKNKKSKKGRIQNIKNINNNKVFSDNKKQNISLPYKYDIYPTRKIFKTYTKLIKNIITEDNRIYININYYFLTRNKKPSMTRYNFVHPCEKITICLIGNNKNKLKASNLKVNLSEIKEEEGKNQKIDSKEKKDDETKSIYQRYKKKRNNNVET